MDSSRLNAGPLQDRASAVGYDEQHLAQRGRPPQDDAVGSADVQHGQLVKRCCVEIRLVFQSGGTDSQSLPEDAADVLSPADQECFKTFCGRSTFRNRRLLPHPMDLCRHLCTAELNHL